LIENLPDDAECGDAERERTKEEKMKDGVGSEGLIKQKSTCKRDT